MRQQEVLWRLEDQVNPEHTALLVIDPQNDFCANDGAAITPSPHHTHSTRVGAYTANTVSWASASVVSTSSGP